MDESHFIISGVSRQWQLGPFFWLFCQYVWLCDKCNHNDDASDVDDDDDYDASDDDDDC